MQIDPAVHVITTAGSASGRKEICNHFCRTGRCKHGARCNYVHDRDKVRCNQPILDSSSGRLMSRIFERYMSEVWGSVRFKS
jgi:hypothetical protein